MRTRGVDLARLSLGAVALARPDSLLLPSIDPHGRLGESGRVRALVRVLGTRYLIQSMVGVGVGRVGRVGRRWVPQVDASIDLIHAATMLALASVDRPHRRLALLSAGVATAFAAADLYDSQVAADD